MEFIDEPVYNIIQYFSGMMNNYLTVAGRLAVLLAVIGIVWNGIQVALGTMEPRKYIVGMIIKWLFFIFCMTFFLSFSSWILKFSKQIGLYVSGNAIASCEKMLSDYYKNIKKLVNKELKSNEEAINELSDVIEKNMQIINENKLTVYNGKLMDSGSTLINKAQNTQQADIAIMNAEKQKNELKRKVDNYKKYTKNGRIYNALQSILIIDDSNVTDRYYMDLEMKDSQGKSTGYLSPAAILKVAVLCTQLIWENEWSDNDVVEWKDGQFGYKSNGKPIKPSKAQKVMIKAQRKIFDVVVALILCITLLVTIIASLIQYIMGIIEYSVCTGISLLLIPCMLFEGTKDMANKILPSLFAQAMKLAMIYVCMFFCLWIIMDMATNLLMLNGSIDWIFFAYVIFSSLLTFTVTSNAPKLAEALMSGRPMLSMGEFVQTLAATAAGTRLATSAVKTGVGGVKKLNSGAQGVARFGANRIGDLAEATSSGTAAAAEKAVDDISKTGTTSKRSQAGAWMKGFASNLAQQTGRRMKGAAGDWIRGGSGEGSNGGGRGSSGGADPMKWMNDDPSGTGNGLGDTKSYDFASSKNVDKTGHSYTTRKSFRQYMDSRQEEAKARTAAARAKMESMFSTDTQPMEKSDSQKQIGNDQKEIPYFKNKYISDK